MRINTNFPPAVLPVRTAEDVESRTLLLQAAWNATSERNPAAAQAALKQLEHLLSRRSPGNRQARPAIEQDAFAAMTHLVDRLRTERNPDIRKLLANFILDNVHSVDYEAQRTLESALNAALNATPARSSSGNAGKGSLLRKLSNWRNALAGSSLFGQRKKQRFEITQFTSMRSDHTQGSMQASTHAWSGGAREYDQRISRYAPAHSTAPSPASSSTPSPTLMPGQTNQTHSTQLTTPSLLYEEPETAYDAMIQALKARGWSDDKLKTLQKQIEMCLPSNKTGNNLSTFTQNLKIYQKNYVAKEGLSDNVEWMKDMASAIRRYQAGRSVQQVAPRLANANLNDNSAQRSVAALSEEEQIARAIWLSELEARRNNLDGQMSEMAEGNRLFRLNMAKRNISIIPNDGDRNSNTCLIVAMLQQAGAKDSESQTLTAEALKLKREMAAQFSDEVQMEGMMSAESTSRAVKWLCEKIAELTHVKIDPHIVMSNEKGEPILVEPDRDVKDGHTPVVIWNQGRHFEALISNDAAHATRQERQRAVFDLAWANTKVQFAKS